MKTGNGSIYATTEDLYRFDRALANRTLIEAPGVDSLFVEHYPSNGYGWFVGERFGSREVYIGGRSPGFGSYWGRSVDDDVTVIVLGNIYNGAPNAIGPDLMAMVLGQAYEPSSIRADPPNPRILSDIVGSYQFDPDFYRPNGSVSFHIEDGHLFSGRAWVIPTSDGELDFVHRVYWSHLEFLRDDKGQVDRLRYDNFVGQKQP